MSTKIFELQITVQNAKKQAQAKLKVEAWLIFPKKDEQLGSGTTDGKGSCTLELQLDPKTIKGMPPTVYVLVYRGNHLIYGREGHPTYKLLKAETKVVLKVEDEEITNEGPLSVNGHVIQANGTNIEEATIVAYHKDICEEILLGKTQTDSQGIYQINYHPVKEGQSTNLIVKAQQDQKHIATSPMILNAKEVETVNLVEGGGKYIPPSKIILMQRKLDEVLQYCRGLSSLTTQDVALITERLELSDSEVINFIKARRLTELIDTDFQMLYAYLGRISLGSERSAQSGVPPSINPGLATDPVLLFEESSLLEHLGRIYRHGKRILLNAIESAANENEIPLPLKSHAEDLVRGFRKSVLNYVKKNKLWALTPAIKVMQLSGLTLPEMIRYQEALDDMNPLSEGFERQLINEKKLPKSKVKKLQLNNQLRVITNNNWSLAKVLNQDKRIKRGLDLAQFNQVDWMEFIQEASKEEKRADSDAQVLAKKLMDTVERQFPTPFLAARMKEDKAFNSQHFDIFFQKNEGFEFKRTNLTYYLKTTPGVLNGIKEEEQETFIEELKATERLFKITPDQNRHQAFSLLWEDNLHSSRAIVSQGEVNFINSYKGGLGEEGAKLIFNRAEHVVAMNLNALATFGREFNSTFPVVIGDIDFPLITNGDNPPEGTDPLEILNQGGIDIPDLETLFGALDYCGCKHCRSVYSPAAYLTDLLAWLDEKPQDSGDDTIKDALFTYTLNNQFRRAEIGHILLNCENTNTALPYIDLVNEILENAVSPYADNENYSDFRLQTALSTEELKANPEHINHDAYDELNSQVYPWNLPFNLWLEESQVYMNHMGVPYYELLDALPSPVTEIQVSLAYLGISNEEKAILTDSSITTSTIKKYFGLSPSDSITDLIPSSGKIEILTLLKHSTLSYNELLDYLKSKFINPEGKLIIFGSASCALSEATLAFTKSELGRLHRFVRLHRKLDWSVIELDKTLNALNASNITNTVIITIAQIKKLQGRLETSLVEMLSWWNQIDVQDYGDELSHYHRLFLTKTVNNPIIADFILNANEPSNGNGHYLDTPTNEALIPFITGALSIKESDFHSLLSSSIPGNTGQKELSLKNLSHFYRVSSFSKALGISVDDYLSLSSLTGRHGLKSLFPLFNAKPADTLQFIERFDLILSSGFSIDELRYILRQEYQEIPGFVKSKDDIAAFLVALRNQLLATSLANINVSTIDEKKNVVKRLLSYLITEEQGVNESILVIEDNSTVKSADVITQQETLIDTYLSSFGTPVEMKAKLVDSNGNDYLVDTTERLDYIISILSTYINNEILPSEYRSIVLDNFTNLLAVESPIVAKLLENDFITSLGPNQAIGLFASNSFIQESSDINFDNSSFTNQFKTTERLIKVAFLFSKFGTTESELEYLFINRPDNWLDYVALPTYSEPNPGPFAAFRFWENTANTYHHQKMWSKAQDFRFVGILNTVKKIINEQGEASLDRTVDVILPLANNTSWREADLDYLLGSSSRGFKISGAEWEIRDWLGMIGALMEVLGKLQVSAEQAFLWNRSSPNGEMATAVRNAAKAKHSYEQWLSIAPPLRDVLREKQRDALTAYLTGIGSTALGFRFKDNTSLFEYFLVDTEMSSCTMTTRIKLAISSVQSLVQRIMMSLEPNLSLSRACMEEWKWRKNYRVWEANRKVFLYPENWIIPELRDDKTVFFRELEDEILQDEITEQTATTIFKNYLEKLDEVAFLEIAGMYKEEDADTATNILHVFARTKSHPHKYYYRKWMDETYWTGWEKVEVDIEGEHLTPVVYNDRLLIFWLQIIEKGKASDSSGSNVLPITYYEIKLCWSEYKNDKWLPKKLSKSSFTTEDEGDDWGWGGDSKYYLDKSKYYIQPEISPTTLKINIWLEWFNIYVPTSGDQSKRSFTGHFTFIGNTLSPIVSKTIAGWIDFIGFDRAPQALLSSYSQNKFHFDNSVVYSYQSFDDTTIVLFANNLNIKGSIKYSHQYEWFNDNESFFYEDSQNVLFIQQKYKEWWDYLGEQSLKLASIFTHPYLSQIKRLINKKGINGVLKPNLNGLIEEQNLAYQNIEDSDFIQVNYTPNVLLTGLTGLPSLGIDFTLSGGYSIYNWEFFFHAPFLIACRLSENQQFSEAQKWFHYIFDPTETVGNSPDRYWRTKPFHNYSGTTTIQQLAYWLNQGNDEAETQVELWRKNPFNPHLIARMRIAAYMKSVVMKYLDNLIAWGDQLFRRDTIESINEASQVYILAVQILGRKPELIQRNGIADKSYNDLEPALDAFSNALVALENTALTGYGSTGTGSSGTGTVSGINALYYCIPKNDKLLGYWDTVADRLFKIRHCMNIEGVVRQLPLFAPPIDPGALVNAAAAGVDIGGALGSLNAPLPYYRFQYMIQKAFELVAEVKSLGSALLQAIEKRDAEKIALIRAEHEVGIQESVKDLKELAIRESEETIKSLEISKSLVKARFTYYSTRKYMNKYEQQQLKKLQRAMLFQTIGQGIEILSPIMALIPDVDLGVSGLSSPVAKAKFGGQNLYNAIMGSARVLNLLSSLESQGATKASIKGGYDRRRDDWLFQASVAAMEIPQIDKQIEGAKIRKMVAEKDLSTIEKQIENAKQVAAFMEDKFSNIELYDWMKTQVSDLYLQTYQMAFDIAKQAEKCYQHELAIFDTSFIGFGYWNSLKKGLLAGEQLYKDLKRMELSYLEQNRRQYELSKQVSLALLDPLALLNLQETGSCDFNIPEILFDLDFPGHYGRRIKSVSLTIPCVVGPYTGVPAKLTLLGNRIRHNATYDIDNPNYEYTGINDGNFYHNLVGIQSIATSSAQNDSGVFQLNFEDSRYLPFEGAGAISSWRLELPDEFRPFDYESISDVIVQINYTAKEGGGLLKSIVNNHLKANLNKVMDELATTGEGFHRLFSMKQEFPDALYEFLNPSSSDNILNIEITAKHFPYTLRNIENKDIIIKNISIIINSPEGAFTGPENELKLDIKDGTEEPLHSVNYGGDESGDPPVPSFSNDPSLGNLPSFVLFDDSNDNFPNLLSDALRNSYRVKVTTQIDAAEIKDVLILLDYQVA